MFCPKCRAEYREGFNTCSDCHVELIEDLPPLADPVRLMVRDDQVEDAIDLIKDVKLSVTGIGLY